MASFFSAGGSDTSNRLQQDQSGTSRATATPSFGNLPFFEQGFPGLFQPSGAEQGFLGSIQGLASQPRYTPEMQMALASMRGLQPAWGGTSGETSSYTTAMNAIQGLMGGAGRDPQAINTIRQLLASSMGGAAPLELSSLETMRGRTDPTALNDAAMRYFTNIVEPGARAGLQAGGMGGVKGGAYSEMLGREGSRLALPLAQMIQQALGEYGGAQMGLGGRLEERRTGLAGILEQMRQGQVAEESGLANQLFGMRGTLDDRYARQAGQLFGMGGADARLSELPILSAGLQAAGMPRLGSLQDFLRQQQLALLQRGMTTSGATTGSTGGRTTGSTSQPITAGSILGPLTGLGAAALLSPASKAIFESLFGSSSPGGLGGGGNFPGVFGDTNQFQMPSGMFSSDPGVIGAGGAELLPSLLDFSSSNTPEALEALQSLL